jgi:hypothetical protein
VVDEQRVLSCAPSKQGNAIFSWRRCPLKLLFDRRTIDAHKISEYIVGDVDGRKNDSLFVAVLG